MPPILDERIADRNVITSLLNEIRRLQPMGKLLKDNEGRLYQADAYTELTEYELRQYIKEQTEQIVAVQNNIEDAKRYLPEFQTQTTEETPAPVEQPVPEPTPIPVTETPTEPTLEPVAPVAEAPQAPVLQ